MEVKIKKRKMKKKMMINNIINIFYFFINCIWGLGIGDWGFFPTTRKKII